MKKYVNIITAIISSFNYHYYHCGFIVKLQITVITFAKKYVQYSSGISNTITFIYINTLSISFIIKNLFQNIVFH